MSRGTPLRILALGLAVAGLVGCSDAGQETAETSAAPARSEAPETCPAAVHSDLPEGLDLARAVIDASQNPDLAGICELIGRRDIPEGVRRYSAAIRGGLTTDIEYLDMQQDPTARTEAYRFGIPDGEASGGVLGLGFQRQSEGWVLLTALFIPSE